MSLRRMQVPLAALPVSHRCLVSLSDPSRRILLRSQSRKDSGIFCYERGTFLILLPSLMIFIHISCDYFILGTSHRALSFRCHAFECFGEGTVDKLGAWYAGLHCGWSTSFVT